MTTVADVDLSSWNRYPSSPRLRGSNPFGSNLIRVGQAIESDLAQSIATGGLNTPFAITREASRTSGTAPLSVFFTAGFSASDGTNRDFHDLHYAWDFDDAGAGTWANSGKSKETDIGAVASHVFESAGTHTVTLTVIDPSTGSTLDTDTFSIIVTAADTTYSTTNTICINKVGDIDFAGAPTGALEVNNDDLATIISTYNADNKRILFKRGSTWGYSGSVISLATVNLHIGAYGTGTSPDSLGIFSNAPVFTITGTSNVFNISNTVNFKLTDLAFNGNATSQSVTGTGTNIQQLFLFKLKTTGFSVPLGWGHWRNSDTDLITENSVISCDVSGANLNNMYLGGDKLSVIGNTIYNASTSHVTRVWWAHKGVIAHNDISGSSLDNTNARHGLKMHGPKEGTELGTFAETGNGGLPEPTRFVMVSNNIVGSSGYVPLSIGPQDASSNENVSDIIFEKNKIIAEHGDTSTTLPSKGINIEGRYHTLRNNVFDGTSTTNNYTAIVVERRGIEDTPLGIHVYNNTIYNNGIVINGPVGIEINALAVDTVAANNFVSFPTATSDTLITDNSGTSVLTNNSMTNTPTFADPNNVTPLSRDFALGVGSSAIDAGSSVLVYDDFDDTVRSGTFEQGAYQYAP